MRVPNAILVLSSLALSGCAAGVGLQEERNSARHAQELAGRIAGPPRRCVPGDQSQNLVIVDRRTLTVERGSVLWVNQLRNDCPGLDPFDTLIVEKFGSDYCRGDRVRSVTPGQSIPGGICVLGDFTPYRKPG